MKEKTSGKNKSGGEGSGGTIKVNRGTKIHEESATNLTPSITTKGLTAEERRRLNRERVAEKNNAEDYTSPTTRQGGPVSRWRPIPY